MEDGWVEDLARELPPPVQVTTCQIAPEVAVDDTIWVEHWDDLEDVLVPKVHSPGIVTGEEIDNPLHDPRSVRSSRVNSGSEDDAFLLLIGFLGSSTGDCEVLALVSSDCPTESASRHVAELL